MSEYPEKISKWLLRFVTKEGGMRIWFFSSGNPIFMNNYGGHCAQIDLKRFVLK